MRVGPARCAGAAIFSRNTAGIGLLIAKRRARRGEVARSRSQQVVHSRRREGCLAVAHPMFASWEALCSRRRRRAPDMLSQSETVIGKDLKFAGQDVKVVSRGRLKVDCEFEGDVTGAEVVISERGKVRGKVV